MKDKDSSKRTLAEEDSELRTMLATQVKEQPDPFLQMSMGRLQDRCEQSIRPDANDPGRKPVIVPFFSGCRNRIG